MVHSHTVTQSTSPFSQGPGSSHWNNTYAHSTNLTNPCFWCNSKNKSHTSSEYSFPHLWPLLELHILYNPVKAKKNQEMLQISKPVRREIKAFFIQYQCKDDQVSDSKTRQIGLPHSWWIHLVWYFWHLAVYAVGCTSHCVNKIETCWWFFLILIRAIKVSADARCGWMTICSGVNKSLERWNKHREASLCYGFCSKPCVTKYSHHFRHFRITGW